MPVEYQVIIIYAATKKYLLDVAVDDIMRFEKELFEFIDTKYPELPNGIRTEKQLSEEDAASIEAKPAEQPRRVEKPVKQIKCPACAVPNPETSGQCYICGTRLK